MANKTPENKHDKFLRLMTKRLGRALDELRLIAQLSSLNYENTAEEAHEVMVHLDGSIHQIADSFGVEYVSRIARGKPISSSGAPNLAPKLTKTTVLDPVEIARVLDHIRTGNTDEAEKVLRSALT